MGTRLLWGALTDGGVHEGAAQGAAEEQARGEAVVGDPDAHEVVGRHRAQRVLARAVPALRNNALTLL